MESSLFRILPLLLLLSSGTCVAQEDHSRTAEARRPNVVLLFADDQRFDAVGAWGDGVLKTPHLDSLVAKGMSFRRAYVAGSVHGAVCMPSRAMLHTGRHFRQLPLSMISLWSVPQEQRGQCEYPTLFETFDAAGYETFATGKWHNGPRSIQRGLDGGDAIFFGGMSDHDKVPIHAFDPSGEYPAASKSIGAKFSSELFADAAIQFLKERTAEQDPFFLYVAFSAPHDPRMAPEPFASTHPPGDIPLPPNFAPKHPFPIGDLHVRDEELAPFPRTPEIVREHIAGYWAMMEHLDAQVGRILQALQASGQADETIVVYAADNGLAVGQHGLLGKQNLYEHSARVPMILVGPGVPQRSSEALCYIHDLFPTLCDLTGIPVPESVTARSLAPLIRGEVTAIRSQLALSYQTSAIRTPVTSDQRALVTPTWKLLRSLHEGHAVTRLFDLSSDPWELADQSGTPEQAARQSQMAKALAAELEANGDNNQPSIPGWNLESDGEHRR